MDKIQNVMKTRELGVCLSCEICSAGCPKNAITTEYLYGQFLPKVDYSKCSSCGLCLDICPGIDVDISGLRAAEFTDSMFDGPWLDTYTGYSKDLGVRKGSASGGLVTSFMVELLKNREFDTAFVLPFDNLSNQPARLKATEDINELIKCAGSKYIPASVYEIVNTVRNQGSSRKIVVVGTSCQIHGIKKYLTMRHLAADNILFLGLFCDRTLNFNILRYFEEAYAKSKEKLVRFQFRTKERNGWPGNTMLSFDSGRQLIVNRNVRMHLKSFFQLKRCLFCTDKLNQGADISFGDCYIPGKGDIYGKSSAIIRTGKGKKVFDKYSYLFSLEKSNILAVRESQNIAGKKQNLEYMRVFIKENSLYPGSVIPETSRKSERQLSSSEKLIDLGKNYKPGSIKLNLFMSRAHTTMHALTLVGMLGTAAVRSLFPGKNVKGQIVDKSASGNIIITGAGLSNKGAQAMTFTAVDQLKRRFPNKHIYLMSSADYMRNDEEKDLYNFTILPWDWQIIMELLNPFNRRSENSEKYNHFESSAAQIRKVIRDADYFVDLGGYRLFSDGKVNSAASFLLDMMVAKRFSVPYYVLPQSMGPFNCHPAKKLFLYTVIKLYLPYARKIYLREEEGFRWVKKFTRKNVEKRQDIVLTNKNYDLGNIYVKTIEPARTRIAPGSVAIIPNQRVLERTTRDYYFNIYRSLIQRLLSAHKTVYIMRHSYEDLAIVEELKRLFAQETKVITITDDMSPMDFENLIEQFDFVIASRYHSIVHTYKGSVPSLVIGWAEKYSELLDIFGQGDYWVDIRKHPNPDDILSKLEKLLSNYVNERKCIGEKLALLQITGFPEIG